MAKIALRRCDIPFDEAAARRLAARLGGKQALSGIVDEYSNLAPDLYDIITKLAD